MKKKVINWHAFITAAQVEKKRIIRDIKVNFFTRLAFLNKTKL